MAQLQRRNPMKKKGKSWCVVFDLLVTFALKQAHKSEEDLQLRGELEMLVERLKEPDTTLYRPALETLRALIRTSTSSMTSVPKPLKFLRPHYPELQIFMNSGLPQRTRDWGHEYVRHLAAELGEEYNLREQTEAPKAAPEVGAAGLDSETDDKDGEKVKPQIPLSVGTLEDLHDLALVCATFLLEHNAEPDAVDLLEELEAIDRIVNLVDANTYSRVAAYMIACVNLLPPQDDVAFLKTAHMIYEKHQRFPEALSLAIRLNDPDLIRKDFHAPGNQQMKRQLAYILARAQVPYHWLQPPTSDDGGNETSEELPEELQEILFNSRLSTHFKQFGQELGVQDPKSLEDVYKSHLETSRSSTVNVDSARGNLAGTFVNAFVNAGFGNDKLMVDAEEGNSWIYKNKDHGMLSAAASLGLSLLWDADIGLSHAGAFLATGILNTGVHSEADAALALLGEHITNKSVPLRTSAIIGLGFAYAGSHRDDILGMLTPLISDDDISMEIASLAALAVGLIFTLMERDDRALDEKWTRFLGLGLALLYVGVQASDSYDATIETLKAIPHQASKQIQVLVEMCAFAGTGNVLRVQTMLQQCGEHLNAKDAVADSEQENEKKKADPKQDDTFQAFAVLGISLVAMGEDIGAEMSLRQFNHLMHYGDPVIRKSVPLALGLVSASNPQLPILDILSKYSHDNDLAVALNAIFAMGLVGAGTNNARLAQMLRQLAGYYHKEPDCLFMVRIAQGLVHMGKGTIGINPFYLDRAILNKPAVAGLLATLTAFTDAKAFVLDKYHWMLYFLVPAMYPRFLITLDEDLEPKPVTVRVGTAVDVVGQAGKPRTISGFQTYQTPVRLATTERAELATEEYIPFASVLEGFVLLQKNPGWEEKMEL
ncbi:armadillo-type protein [Russula vinacea]|nr:armadillo-type protein [Russula vinacea]